MKCLRESHVLVGVISLLVLSIVAVCSATQRYVDIDNNTPVAPYNDWSTAATSVNDAIAVCSEGDAVLVRDGNYALSGMLVLTNIVLESVHGAEQTIFSYGQQILIAMGSNALVRGFSFTGATNGSQAVELRLGARMYDCRVFGNVIQGDEYAVGGIYASERSLIADTHIYENIANCVSTNELLYAIGGVAMGKQSVMTNCVVADNQVVNNNLTNTENGVGGVYLEDSYIHRSEIVRNTVTGRVQDACGGVRYDSGCRLIESDIQENRVFCSYDETNDVRVAGGVCGQGSASNRLGLIERCSIVSNVVTCGENTVGYVVGGVYFTDNSLSRTNKILDSEVSYNRVSVPTFAGLYCVGGVYGGHLSITNVRVCGNMAIGGVAVCVGGISTEQESSMARVQVNENRADSFSMAIGGVWAADSQLTDMTIRRNCGTAAVGNSAGGAFLGDTLLRNGLFSENTSTSMNFAIAGVWCEDAVLENCTCAGNSASVDLPSGMAIGGVFVGEGRVINSIFQDNIGEVSNFDSAGGYVGDGTNVFEGTAGSTYFKNSCFLTFAAITNGEDTISDDAGFINARAKNYRLNAASPCRDSGFFQDWMTNALDVAGLPRIRRGAVDRGAYEFVAVDNDFDGDGLSDIGCYYALDGQWYIRKSQDGFWTKKYGYAGTTLVTGDFDGDGYCDYGVYYAPSGLWNLYKSSAGPWSTAFGYLNTVPISGDFDGDGIVDFGCYYAPGGDWYIYRSSEGFWHNNFGYTGTVPVTGDFDGDGRCDFGCYYAPGGNWYIFKTTEGFWQNNFGYSGTVPVTGDFDGDGRCDFGCYYAPEGYWYLYKSSEGFWVNKFGYGGTVPVTGDYDGDGCCDYGCYYAPGGNWYVLRSHDGFWTTTLGFEGTVPIGQ